MLERLGRFTVRRRRWILVATLGALVFAGAFGGKVADHLSTGGFDDPSSESSRAADALNQQFHTGNANFVLLVHARGGSVDDPAVARQGLALTRRLAGEANV